MQVASTAGFSVGHMVDIDPGTEVHETNTIQAFGSVIFANPLQFAHQPGAVISQAPATEAPSQNVPGLKEEVYYNIGRMRSIPSNLDTISPSAVRVVKELYYQNTWRSWPGFKASSNFAVRWTGSIKIGTSGNYNWCTSSDDGSKLYIDDALVVNNDGLHGWRTKCSSASMKSGYRKLTGTFFEISGHAGIDVQYSGADTSNEKVRVPSSVLFNDGKIPTTTTTTPGPPPFTPPSGLVAGLKEEVYYNMYRMSSVPTDLDKRSPSVTRAVKEPYYANNRNWQGFTQSSNYAVRWTGWVKISSSGAYEWCTLSDDGSKLYIDDALVVNNDGLHGWRERCASFGVSSGSHKFKALFFERGGGAGMEVKYNGADTSEKKVRIPSSMLFT